MNRNLSLPGRNAAERLFALLMAAYFFLVICSFWILKPLKKGLFIEWYDQQGASWFGFELGAAQLELVAKVLNVLVALAAVIVFSKLSQRLRREKLTYVFSAFFAGACLWFHGALAGAGEGTVWAFYLLGDLYSTVMVATFFAFLNDSVSPSQARSLYGFIGVGGVLGGAFGTLALRIFIATLDTSSWLLVVVGLTGAICAVAFWAARFRVDLAKEPDETPAVPSVSRPALWEALDGARLVLGSRYLLCIAGIVVLYELVSTIFDFQFSATVAHYLDGRSIREHFSTVYLITACVSVLVQMFLTGSALRRFGVGAALLALPAVMLLGSAAFAVLPILWVGSFLNTADNGFAYSINQSAKEALYVPLSAEEKYKAKAFIDMFGQRLAKFTAALVSLVITAVALDLFSLRILSIVSSLVIVAWIAIVRRVGRGFDQRVERVEATGPGRARSATADLVVNHLPT